MNAQDLKLLNDIYEHLDGIADGAHDASYAAKMALQFSEPLKRLLDREQGESVETQLSQAARISNRAWDETVQRLRDEGKFPPIG